MPTAAQFQALHDELRQLGAVFGVVSENGK